MSLAYICHYSEIGLKGNNRLFFERTLMQNIRRSLKTALPGKTIKIEKLSKRLIVSFEQDVDDSVVLKTLGNVFGTANFGPVRVVDSDYSQFEPVCLEQIRGRQFDTFAIRAVRADKNFPMNSMEVNRQLGAAVVKEMGKKVKLKQPDLTYHLEILKGKSYLYVDKINGPGGLPVGSSGRVMVLMSGGFDSPIAAYFAQKRGARCEYIHFHSYPFTQKTSQEKVQDLVKEMNKFQFRGRLYMVPFAETQKEIVLSCPDKYRIILYRRFMMRIAEKMAHMKNIKALVTGESLGQVASQTLENMGVVEAVTSLPVLRPLIGLDKNEIMDIARRIGTYDISVLPHDDACTRFMPKQPVIHARLNDVLEAEKELDVEGLVQRDIEAIEVVDL